MADPLLRCPKMSLYTGGLSPLPPQPGGKGYDKNPNEVGTTFVLLLAKAAFLLVKWSCPGCCFGASRSFDTKGSPLLQVPQILGTVFA